MQENVVNYEENLSIGARLTWALVRCQSQGFREESSLLALNFLHAAPSAWQEL